MSLENLERLYDALTKKGLIPTNRSKLESMETKDLVKELFKQFDFSKADVKPKDVTKWMNSYIGSESKKK